MDTVDIVSGIVALEEMGGKGILVEVLRPLATKIGEDIRDSYSALISDNIRNLYKFITQKRKENGNKNINPIPLPIFNEINKNGIYQEGEIFSDYYAGVICASQENGSDIGKEICQTISRLSSYSLRFHYIVYNAFRNTYINKVIYLENGEDCILARIFITNEEMDRAMGFSSLSREEKDEIYRNCLATLVREGLLYDRYAYGNHPESNINFEKPEMGFTIGPSASGASLLLWAAGYGLKPGRYIYDSQTVLSPENFPSLSQVYIPKATKVRGGTSLNGPRSLLESQRKAEYLHSPSSS